MVFWCHTSSVARGQMPVGYGHFRPSHPLPFFPLLPSNGYVRCDLSILMRRTKKCLRECRSGDQPTTFCTATAPPPKKITAFLEMLEGLESSLGVYGATASTNEFRQFKSRPGRPGEQLGKIAWRKWNWPARKHAIYATISSSAVSSLCSTNGCIAGGANLQLEGSNNCLWKFYHASFINFLAGPGGPLVRCPRKDHLWNAWVVWEVVVGQVGYVVCRQGAAVDGGGGCG